MIQDPLLKMIMYRCEHRGIREADILIGSFARKHLELMDDQQRDDFIQLLDLPDQDLLQYCMGLTPIPSHYDTPVMELLKTYAESSS